MAGRWRMPVAVLLVGLAAGAGGVALTLLLHGVQHLLYGYTEATFLVGVEHASRLRRLLAVTGGGVVVGAAWWLHRRYVAGDSLSVTRAVREGTARLPLVHSIIDAAIQIVAVGAGASLGREGAPRQTGAALADWLGGRLRVTPAQRRTLLACGAGAGLGAVYDVPLAGAAFTLELLLVSVALRDLIPALATSVIATVVAWPVLSTRATYDVGAASFRWSVLVWALLAGPLLGAIGLGFGRLMEWSRTHAPSGPRSVLAVPAGFAVVGALAGLRPELLGNGKGLAEVAFTGGFGLGTGVLLALLKPLATAICLRSGAIGGLLTPAFATGAALGACGGLLWTRLWGGGSILDYALVGAAALLAVTQRAAITAVVLTLELTRTGLLVLPAIIVAVALAVGTARLLRPRPDRDNRVVSEPRLVVAAAILSLKGDRVLAARRTTPPEAAGRWELPGGKVEPGETPEAALVREIGEEFGCLIDVLDWLPGEPGIGEAHVLRAATARITAGEARPREHDQVRWLAADELDEVDWLEPDRPFLAPLRQLLDPDAPDPDVRLRAVFFEESHARSAADQLRRDGWEAELARERYQGEDDDESHPWSVSTDAPGFMVEMLVDEYDGWLDVPEDEESEEESGDTSQAPEPLDLPTAPRGIQGQS